MICMNAIFNRKEWRYDCMVTGEQCKYFIPDRSECDKHYKITEKQGGRYGKND